MSCVSLRNGALLAVALLSFAATANAQTGATLTPNQRNYMVNKDIGAERWTINLNLATSDPASVVNATGNIFRADGGPPSFVLCQVRPDSNGTLNDPASTFRFTCQGTDACQTTATQCAREDWQGISQDVPIAASFFLPAAGLGSPASAAGASAPVAARTSNVTARLRALLRAAWSGLRVWVAGGSRLVTPSSAIAQANERGATLSLDNLNFLVNKDVGAERWSISLNFVPTQSEQGGIVPRLESVTGNVFQPDGSPPSFIYCTPRGDSTGSLDDPLTEFRFSCQGTSACDSTARDCAQNRWALISDDVRLPSGFFLPPGGLPATVQSDPEIVVIGRTSDPPSIVSGDFTTTAGASSERPSGACPTGETCFVSQLGSCEDVRGRVIEAEGIGCGCFVENVSGQCVGCGDGASGQCGGDCAFPVGGAQARGQCLPFTPGSSDCACYAVGSGQSQTVQGCGGPQNAGCSGDRCCTDDPRDGCDPFDGGAGCFGICVAADGCNPAVEQCGSCLAPDGQFCGNRSQEGSEECDGSDLGGESCSSFGFPGGGQLRCTAACGFDPGDCSQGGNNPPEILDLDFPPVIDPNGGPVGGSVSYSDPDGDIVRANFEPLEGNIDPFSFDPDVFGSASGSFDFFVNCNGNVEDYLIAVTLEDNQGNVSDPELLEFSCESTAECGNGEIETGESCDPPGASGGCGAGFLCTNDCSQCVSATSCEGRCCPGRDDFCTPPQAQCYCDEACRGFQDCCEDVSSACGF